jgi:hypothetical protein
MWVGVPSAEASCVCSTGLDYGGGHGRAADFAWWGSVLSPSLTRLHRPLTGWTALQWVTLFFSLCKTCYPLARPGLLICYDWLVSVLAVCSKLICFCAVQMLSWKFQVVWSGLGWCHGRQEEQCRLTHPLLLCRGLDMTEGPVSSQ